MFFRAIFLCAVLWTAVLTNRAAMAMNPLELECRIILNGLDALNSKRPELKKVLFDLDRLIDFKNNNPIPISVKPYPKALYESLVKNLSTAVQREKAMTTLNEMIIHHENLIGIDIPEWDSVDWLDVFLNHEATIKSALIQFRKSLLSDLEGLLHRAETETDFFTQADTLRFSMLLDVAQNPIIFVDQLLDEEVVQFSRSGLDSPAALQANLVAFFHRLIDHRIEEKIQVLGYLHVGILFPSVDVITPRDHALSIGSPLRWVPLNKDDKNRGAVFENIFDSLIKLNSSVRSGCLHDPKLFLENWIEMQAILLKGLKRCENWRERALVLSVFGHESIVTASKRNGFFLAPEVEMFQDNLKALHINRIRFNSLLNEANAFSLPERPNINKNKFTQRELDRVLSYLIDP